MSTVHKGTLVTLGSKETHAKPRPGDDVICPKALVVLRPDGSATTLVRIADAGS